MALTKVWIRTVSDGLIRADEIVGISTHATPALPSKAPHWLVDATLALAAGSGGRDAWDIGPLHRTLIQTHAEPAGAAEEFAMVLAALSDKDAAGIVTPVAVAESPSSGPGDTTRVRFHFDAFADRQS